jgi:hypothetical protein
MLSRGFFPDLMEPLGDNLFLIEALVSIKGEFSSIWIDELSCIIILDSLNYLNYDSTFSK